MMILNFLKYKINIAVLSGLIFFISFISSSSAGTLDAKKIKEANRLYAHEEYDQALEIYNELLLKDRNSQLLNYNAAAAYYKKGDYEKARQFFNKALTTQDKNMEAKTAYNIGNCHFKLSQSDGQGQTENAFEELKEALNYYQRAIELNQKDDDAKFNYELTAKKLEGLKQELGHLQNQQNEQQNGEEQQQKKEKQNESQRIQESDQEEMRDESIKNRQIEEKRKEQNKEIEESQQKERSEEKTLKQPAHDAWEMNKEEAEMLISAYAREGLRLDLADLYKEQKDYRAEKDW